MGLWQHRSEVKNMTNMYQDVFAGSISCQKTSLYRVNSNDKKKKKTQIQRKTSMTKKKALPTG